MTTSAPTSFASSLPPWWPVAATGIQLDVLDHHRCLERLGEARSGSLTNLQPAGPVVDGVAFRVDGLVLVLTPPPSGYPVAPGPLQLVLFRVDHVAPDLRSGWTVLTVGRLVPRRPRPGEGSGGTQEAPSFTLDLLALSGRAVCATP